MPLRELAAASVNMPTRPRVYEFRQGNALRLRIDFSNASTPGELLYYIIDPDRGYLATEIGRISNGRHVSKSTIIVGNTADKTWIPARRTTVNYNANGGIASQELWYYQYLELNQKLEPQLLTLLFFNLPQGTKVHPLPASLAKENAAKATPSPATPSAARPVVPQATVQPRGRTTAPAGTPGARRYY